MGPDPRTRGMPSCSGSLSTATIFAAPSRFAPTVTQTDRPMRKYRRYITYLD